MNFIALLKCWFQFRIEEKFQGGDLRSTKIVES
jgi:hypothetical protein